MRGREEEDDVCLVKKSPWGGDVVGRKGERMWVDRRVEMPEINQTVYTGGMSRGIWRKEGGSLRC